MWCNHDLDLWCLLSCSNTIQQLFSPHYKNVSVTQLSITLRTISAAIIELCRPAIVSCQTSASGASDTEAGKHLAAVSQSDWDVFRWYIVLYSVIPSAVTGRLWLCWYHRLWWRNDAEDGGACCCCCTYMLVPCNNSVNHGVMLLALTSVWQLQV